MKSALQSLLLTGLLSLATGSLHAQSMVPAAMNYQGVLTDSNGDPVANAAPENRNIEFRVYSQASGGTPLWGEAQTVTVFKGQFSVVLGNGTAVGGAPSGPASFAAVFANAITPDLYFGITPQGSAEFAPRQKLLSSAYALRARVAERVNQASGDSRFDWVYANNLTMQGHTKIDGGNVLEFGTNDPGRARSNTAGQIGYQVFSNGLDIVGAGPEPAQRRLTLWAEAGTEFKGAARFPFYGQAIELFDSANGIGVQSLGVYSRAFSNFAWYRGGSHNSEALNSGGGTTMATLTPAGFDLKEGVFTGNGSGLTNINPNSLPNNYNYLGINGSNVIEFGRGVAKGGSNGMIGYGAFSSGASLALDIVGAGTQGNFSDRKINLHAQGGLLVFGPATVNGNLRVDGIAETFGPLYAKGDVVIEANKKLNFTTPNRTGQHINLWGSEYGIGIGSSTLYQRTGGAYKWYVGGTHADGGPGTGGNEIANWTNDRCDFYRRVFIGNNTGGIPLDVSGNSSLWLGNVSEFWFPNNGGAGYNGRANWTANISIRASQAVAASSFFATSDIRLKRPEGRSNSTADLATLNTLAVTDYKMKDHTQDGGRPHKKLIAQQVEQVYPQAVSRSNGTVPDIFRLGTAKKGLITFNDEDAHDLKVGDTVRLMTDDGEITSKAATVTDTGFTVKDSIKDGDVFVYGRQVDDLRSVDYEAISMLNVSATQELAKQLKAQAAELATVKAEREALAKEVAELRTATTRQDKRLAAIEAHIEALARPAVKPVSLQAKAVGK
jgi:hypothetical protein